MNIRYNIPETAVADIITDHATAMRAQTMAQHAIICADIKALENPDISSSTVPIRDIRVLIAVETAIIIMKMNEVKIIVNATMTMLPLAP